MSKNFTIIITLLFFFIMTSIEAQATNSCDGFYNDIEKNIPQLQIGPFPEQKKSYGISITYLTGEEDFFFIDYINSNHSMTDFEWIEDENTGLGLTDIILKSSNNEKNLRIYDDIYTINGKRIKSDDIELWDEIAERVDDERYNYSTFDLYDYLNSSGSSFEKKSDESTILGVYRESDFEEGHLPDLDSDLFYVEIYPESAGYPIDVFVDLKINQILSLDPKNNEFKANYTLVNRWYDHGHLYKLANKNFQNDYWCSWSDKDDDWDVIESIWMPSVQWINRGLASSDLVKNEARFIYNPDENYGISIENIQNGVGVFKTNFDYSSFPFDKQSLNIGVYHFSDIGDRGGSQFINVRNVSDGKEDYYAGKRMDMKDTFKEFENSLAGWEIDETEYFINYEVIRDFSELRNDVNEGEWGELSVSKEREILNHYKDEMTQIITLSIPIERHWTYFIFKIIAPIILILLVCWSVFWTSAKELESRLTVTITCFLALVAYTFVIDNDLPQLPYMTLLDFLILMAYFYAAVPTILSIIVHRQFLIHGNHTDTIDKYAKIYGPLSFLFILYLIINTKITELHSIETLKLFNYRLLLL